MGQGKKRWFTYSDSLPVLCKVKDWIFYISVLDILVVVTYRIIESAKVEETYLYVFSILS